MSVPELGQCEMGNLCYMIIFQEKPCHSQTSDISSYMNNSNGLIAAERCFPWASSYTDYTNCEL